jgi:TonB family protein
MKQSRVIGKEPSFSKIIFVSILLHLLFMSLVVIPLKTGVEYRTYQVRLVGPLRTPEVGKPIISRKPPAKTITRKKKTARTVKPKTDMSIEEVKKEIERIRAISELSEKRKSIKEKSKEVETVKKKTPEEQQGSIGITGTEPSGESGSYYSIISHMIWKEWTYPDIERQGLEVVISIRIDKDGNVISQDIEKFSGDILFDRSALRAISRASPFPSPPEELEVGVRFYL